MLELFVSLPQLKQINHDKEELVTNIVEMASKFLLLASVEDGFSPRGETHRFRTVPHFFLSLNLAEKNLQMEPQLEARRQEMLFKVRPPPLS